MSGCKLNGVNEIFAFLGCRAAYNGN